MDVAERERTENKAIAPTIDEVNDNPDELIEMRGEGRYFGVTDPESLIECANCHQKGHKKAQCKVVVCRSCGVVGDHYERQCPKTMVCNNCGEKGHAKMDCKQKFRRIYCQTCGSSGHTLDRCPGIWRSYLTKNDDRKMGLPNNIYCYNCADKGHFGDECTESRLSRTTVSDGSAFSGHNLPKQLRDVYFNMSKKRKRDDGSRHSVIKRPNKTGFLDKVKTVFRGDKKKDAKYDRQPLSHSQSMPYLPRNPRGGNNSQSNNSYNNNSNRGYQRAESVLDFPRGGSSYKSRYDHNGSSYSGRDDYAQGYSGNGGYEDGFRGRNDYQNKSDKREKGRFDKYMPSRSGFLSKKRR